MDQQVWSQVYNPTGSMVLSTALAAVPIVVLLGTLGILEMRAHLAAALGLLAALLVAIFGFGMPAGSAVMAAIDGRATGCSRSAGSSSTSSSSTS